MTKKKKNEMPVYGVTCSKCNSDEIVMNTDTKELVCRNCGQVIEPDLIDIVFRNADNIDILDESAKRLFDMITKLEAKVDKLATGSNADKVSTDPEKRIENTISDLEYKIKLHTQHIEGCYGAISRMKTDIDKLMSINLRLDDDNKELRSTILENIDDIKALRRDLGDLSVKTKDAVLKVYDLAYKVNTMKCDSDTGHITTFGELKVGDKFKIHGTTTPYLKVNYTDENKCLAYNILLCRCCTIPDNYLVVLIDDCPFRKEGDEE